MNWSNTESGVLGMKYAAPVRRMGAVSPATLPMLRIAPVIIEGMAAGITTFCTVCHLVAPSAREPSRSPGGTLMSASSDALMITGSTTSINVRDAARRDGPKPAYFTNSASPNSPNTIDGVPARLLIAIFISQTLRFSLAYSFRYMADNTPRGSAIAMERPMSITVPTMAGNMPPAVMRCLGGLVKNSIERCPVSYTHLRAHETRHDLVCRLLLEKK